MAQFVPRAPRVYDSLCHLLNAPCRCRGGGHRRTERWSWPSESPEAELHTGRWGFPRGRRTLPPEHDHRPPTLTRSRQEQSPTGMGPASWCAF